MTKKRQFVLTEEEKELEKSIAAGEWSESKLATNKKFYESAAKNTLTENKKEARVNIRMTAHELALVKSAAEQEGIPYQTLMSSILHKYLTGQFVDRKVIEEIKAVFEKTA